MNATRAPTLNTTTVTRQRQQMVQRKGYGQQGITRARERRVSSPRYDCMLFYFILLLTTIHFTGTTGVKEQKKAQMSVYTVVWVFLYVYLIRGLTTQTRHEPRVGFLSYYLCTNNYLNDILYQPPQETREDTVTKMCRELLVV
jgi:hypothetical protein